MPGSARWATAWNRSPRSDAVRGRLLLAAALVLLVPNPARPDEEPRAAVSPDRLLVFECGSHKWVFDAGEFPFGWFEDELRIAEELVRTLRARGFVPTAETAARLTKLQQVTMMGVRTRLYEPGTVEFDRDLEVLIANGGRFPEGYQPGGRMKPSDPPELEFLGATVLLVIVNGEAWGRLTEVPDGSRAQKIGLGKGDAIVGVNAEVVGPRGLRLFEEAVAAGRQQGLRVRRTHGEIERIVVDSWDRAPTGR